MPKELNISNPSNISIPISNEENVECEENQEPLQSKIAEERNDDKQATQEIVKEDVKTTSILGKSAFFVIGTSTGLFCAMMLQ